MHARTHLSFCTFKTKPRKLHEGWDGALFLGASAALRAYMCATRGWCVECLLVSLVRAAPVIESNIWRLLRGETLEVWKPQGSFMSLLVTGKSEAALCKGAFVFHGNWVWKLKVRCCTFCCRGACCGADALVVALVTFASALLQVLCCHALQMLFSTAANLAVATVVACV